MVVEGSLASEPPPKNKSVSTQNAQEEKPEFEPTPDDLSELLSRDSDENYDDNACRDGTLSSDCIYLVAADSIKPNEPITANTIRFIPGNAPRVPGVKYITISEADFYTYFEHDSKPSDTIARYLNSLFRQ